MKNRNIGIIGYGFIGQEVVSELLKNTNHKIKIFDRNENNSNIPVLWHCADFKEKNEISKFIKNIDILVHLASSTVPASSTLSGEIDIKENISAMVQILDLVRQINPRLYIIFASSASVYGNQQNLPITEMNLPRPISFHGLQKLSIEHFLRIYNQQYNINYASCRISNPYGFGQKNNNLQGLISIVKNSLKKEKRITIYGADECTRDFIYINDVAKAIVSLCNSDPINCEVNLSSNTEIRISDLLKKIEKVSKKDLLADYKKAREIDIKRSVLDNNLIKSITKWEPLITIDEGINKLFSKDY